MRKVNVMMDILILFSLLLGCLFKMVLLALEHLAKWKPTKDKMEHAQGLIF